jgi:hypothetical protein
VDESVVKKLALIVGAILALPIFAAAFFFGIGLNDEPMQVMPRSRFTPLSLNPTAGFATHRMPGMDCAYIMRVRRVVAGDEVDVYDFQQNTSNYKLTSGGSWVDGSGETFYVRTWYDQSGNGFDAPYPYIDWGLPELKLNRRNGWPAFIPPDGAYYESLRHYTLDDLINADCGFVFCNAKPTGGAVSKANGWELPGLCGYAVTSPSTAYSMGILRGITSGLNRIWARNYDGSDCAVGASYSVNEWYSVTWKHVANVLSIYLDGALVDSVASGNTGAMTSPLRVGWCLPGSMFVGEMNQLTTFDVALSDSTILMMSNYYKGH